MATFLTTNLATFIICGYFGYFSNQWRFELFSFTFVTIFATFMFINLTSLLQINQYSIFFGYFYFGGYFLAKYEVDQKNHKKEGLKGG